MKMLVLITYDVSLDEKGARRLRQVAKVCTNYGQRVQNSVFECILDRAQYTIVKHQLNEIINQDCDSIRFYLLGESWLRNVDSLGKQTSYNPTDNLIV